jgi:hypothetical protein
VRGSDNPSPPRGTDACDVLSHSAELFGTPSKVLGMSEMIHLFSACAFFAEAPQAQHFVQDRRNIGKVLLVP